ncbi:hypothetical protein ACFYT4_26860 [Streptomyces sp. NPDC004609]|uniref:hypothetical protein n=1 Tax=Streptomyces sp. NPDC004609 TaxID=3364704 RepID=UPI0036B3764D
MRNRKLTVAVASGIAGLALFVSGCSGSSDAGEDSSPSGDSVAPGGGSGGDSSAADVVDKDQKLRKCLRDKGIKIADLPPGTDPRAQTLSAPEGTSPEKWQKALEACGTSPQGGSGDGASDQQQSDQQLKIIQCLRGKGFTMPDPKPAQGGTTEAFRIPQGADPDKFMTALNECAA